MTLTRFNSDKTGIIGRPSVVLSVVISVLLSACGSDVATPAQVDLCGGKQAGRFAVSLGGTENDVAFGIAPASDGGFVLVGRSDSLKTGANRSWATRTDRWGRFIWGTDLGPGAGVGDVDIVTAKSGGYLIAHGTMVALKLDDSGKIAWKSTLVEAGAFAQVSTAVASSASGGGVITGVAFTGGGGTSAARDALLIRFDGSGKKIWQQRYSKDVLTQSQDVIALQATGGVTPGYVVAGWAEPKVGQTGKDFWAARTDASGQVVWSKHWGGDLDEEANAIVQTNDDGFVLTGLTRSVGAGNADLWLLKIDGKGKTAWSRAFGGTDTDEGHGISRTAHGGFAITGRRNSTGLGPGGLWLLRVDTTGEMLWQHTYGLEWKTQGRAILSLKDGFAIAGASAQRSLGGDDFWLVRTDVAGRNTCAGALCFGAQDSNCGPEMTCNAEVDPMVCYAPTTGL